MNLRHQALLIAAAGLVVASVWFADVAEGVNQPHSAISCEMCHVPHGATGDNSQVPLWNPVNSTTTLTGFYTSPTMNATPGTGPDGASKLCLSCHDGSYPMSDTHKFGSNPESGMSTLETTHPVSFVYSTAVAEADGALVDPATLPKDVLDAQGKMQCTSCHDVHVQAVDTVKFLRWTTYDPADGISAGFCTHCHLR